MARKAHGRTFTMTNNNDDKFAKESFGMRRMARWQLWGITIVVVVLVIIGLSYASG
jgi:hypothetical protein